MRVAGVGELEVRVDGEGSLFPRGADGADLDIADTSDPPERRRAGR